MLLRSSKWGSVLFTETLRRTTSLACHCRLQYSFSLSLSLYSTLSPFFSLSLSFLPFSLFGIQLFCRSGLTLTLKQEASYQSSRSSRRLLLLKPPRKLATRSSNQQPTFTGETLARTRTCASSSTARRYPGIQTRLTDDLWGLVLEFVLANINGGWQDLYGCGWARCQLVSKDFQRYVLRPQNGNDYIIECFKRRHLHSAHRRSN